MTDETFVMPRSIELDDLIAQIDEIFEHIVPGDEIYITRNGIPCCRMIGEREDFVAPSA